MVFSSIPVYLDPPNWHQQANQLQANGTNTSQLLPLPPLPPQGGGSIRPGSVADRSQLAKMPVPEAVQKCPRCESTNTKFCYFNNYSLSQPRHFCKTCRRYWTRGGALRNVPVGGGCRRNNKKNKRSSRSKSPASSTDKHSLLSSSTSATTLTNPPGLNPELIGTNLPLMASLHPNLRGYGVGNMDHMGFQLGGHSLSTSGGVDQWRLHQFPLLNGFESTTSTLSYPFQSVEAPCGLVGDIGVGSSSRVKLEDNGGLNLSTSQMSIPQNNQYYSWTDLSSGLASSSTSHLL